MTDGNAIVALADKARSSPSWILLSLELFGLGGALAAYAMSPHKPAIVFPFLGIAAFGLFGTVDHVLQTPPRLKSWRRSLLRGFRFVAGAAGVVCAAATVFLISGWMIGTFIS